jgi:UDP-2,4-diacetamido-2,4,6-trideoxy-beta-L-altropyranose hydrolase
VNVVFRVDASQRIGVGHLMRCLTLAEALRVRGVRSRFVCRQLPETIADLIVSKRHELIRMQCPADAVVAAAELPHSAWLGLPQEEDARQVVTALGGHACDWLVVDHYALDARWEQQLRVSASRIFVIDDLADRNHDCDVLLDQNFYEDADTRYSGRVPEDCRLLLGSRYALLREEFERARRAARPRDAGVRRILVFFGGADSTNHTELAIEALRRLDLRDIHVDVVIGAQHPRRSEIEALCAACGFALYVQTLRMAELMLAADLAMGAGGTASWERCCVGLPCLTISVASNQDQVVRDAAIAGALYAPGELSGSPDALARHLRAIIENHLLLASLSRNAMKLADGRGAARVVRAMGIFEVTVRPAIDADSRQLFEWRNHPSIRQVSRSTDVIDWTTHSLWFEAVLANPDRALLIGERDGHTVGVVRFEIAATQAEVSIYMVPGREGDRLGADLLLAAEEWLARSRPDVRSLLAEVLGGNVLSHSLFVTAGYQTGSVSYRKRVN